MNPFIPHPEATALAIQVHEAAVRNRAARDGSMTQLSVRTGPWRPTPVKPSAKPEPNRYGFADMARGECRTFPCPPDRTREQWQHRISRAVYAWNARHPLTTLRTSWISEGAVVTRVA
ncbi:MAG: hypothetical protein KF822_09400 [Steroidobacteraceae bacterium]|nr:hypothetical protein [Steroidobacteraceae bacterium]